MQSVRSSRTSANAYARCVNCGQTAEYSNFEKICGRRCHIHPGQFSTKRHYVGRWSCCGKAEKNASPCRHGHHHLSVIDDIGLPLRAPAEVPPFAGIESSPDGDATMAIAIAMEEAAKVRDAPHGKEPTVIADTFAKVAMAPNALAPTTDDPDSMPKMVEHAVDRLDTLQGIALSYGVSAASIRAANGLFGNSIYERRTLVIPNPRSFPSQRLDQSLSRDGKRNAARQYFLAYAKCSREEAEFYLDDAKFDAQKALKQYREDLEWEARNAKKR